MPEAGAQSKANPGYPFYLYHRRRVRDRALFDSAIDCKLWRLIFEEAPEDHKDIRAAITDLEQAQLVRVIARLRPLLSYKTRAS